MISPEQPPHRPQILKPDQSYTFADYFKLKFTPADIWAELECFVVVMWHLTTEECGIYLPFAPTRMGLLALGYFPDRS